MKLKFETLYKNQRLYVLGKLAGSRIEDQGRYDTSSVRYRRLLYQSVKQEALRQYGRDIDCNAWVFDQNEIKGFSNGKKTLKALCRDVYEDIEYSYNGFWL